MEYTKTTLAKAIHNMSPYTYKEIDAVYYEVVNKHPNRNKYYAKKAGIKRLQAFLKNLQCKCIQKNIY